MAKLSLGARIPACAQRLLWQAAGRSLQVGAGDLWASLGGGRGAWPLWSQSQEALRGGPWGAHGFPSLAPHLSWAPRQSGIFCESVL